MYYIPKICRLEVIIQINADNTNQSMHHQRIALERDTVFSLKMLENNIK